MDDKIKNEIDNMAHDMPIDKFLEMVKNTGEKQKFIEELRDKYPEASIDDLNDIVANIVEKENQVDVKPQVEESRED